MKMRRKRKLYEERKILKNRRIKFIFIFLMSVTLIYLSTNLVFGQCNGTIAVDGSTTNTGLISDCNILLSVKEHFNVNLENWNTDKNINTWIGVDVEDNRVTGLGLYDRDLEREIPAIIGNMINLEYLNLGDNNLNGYIPHEMGNMTNLEYLNLGDNNLNGYIPHEIGNMTNLEYLNLGDNNLNGYIPHEIGNMINLEYLNLGDNNLNGYIPHEMGNMINLEYLNLGDNNLNGYIPHEMGQLSRLTRFYLNNNNLTGEIPKELENIGNKNYFHPLEVFIQNNNLTGCAPFKESFILTSDPQNSKCSSTNSIFPTEHQPQIVHQDEKEETNTSPPPVVNENRDTKVTIASEINPFIYYVGALAGVVLLVLIIFIIISIRQKSRNENISNPSQSSKISEEELICKKYILKYKSEYSKNAISNGLVNYGLSKEKVDEYLDKYF